LEVVTVSSNNAPGDLTCRLVAECISDDVGQSPIQTPQCDPNAGNDCLFDIGCALFNNGIKNNENHNIYVDVRGTSNTDQTGYSFSVKATSYGPESIYTTYLRDDRTDDVNTVTHFNRDILLRKTEFF